jgi:hypothetical protein
MWVIAAIIGLCFVAYPALRARSARKNRDLIISPETIAEVVSADPMPDDFSGDEFRRIKFFGTRPDGEWVNWNIGSGWFDVAGTFHRLETVKAFVRSAVAAQEKNAPHGVFLKANPDNETDANANAIQVYGWTRDPGNMTLLGFVPKDIAAEAAAFMKSVPIAAELKKVAISEKGCFITIAGLWPPVKVRRALEGDSQKEPARFILYDHEIVQVTALIDKMNAAKPMTMKDGMRLASSKAGLASREESEISRPPDGDDASVMATYMSKLLDQWLDFGRPVPPAQPKRIAIILRKARRPDIERQFLAAWCRHFPDGRGAIYAELVERAQKCGAISNV